MDERVKAQLLSIGSVDIDVSLVNTGTSTAGPGAGLQGFFFTSGGRRVRLGVNSDSPLKATIEDNELVIRCDGEILARGLIEEVGSHCPRQVYVTVSERCIYNCRFCPVPLQDSGHTKTIEEIKGIVDEALARTQVDAISITSGVWKTPEEEVERVAEVTRALRRYNLPIGVSVYPTDDSSKVLREAGALEIKYNVETMDRQIFEGVCPGLDLDYILGSLKHAVEVYGRGSVFSNFIIGLGEMDKAVKQGVEELAGMGVIPILRPVNPHPLLAGKIRMERPGPERILRLARMHRGVLDHHGLRADEAKTMCLPCTGCDLTPHRDL